MKKIYLILILTLLVLNKSYAETGEATEYTVTMKKVELCTDASCDSAYIVGERDMEADIAAADAGATVGNYGPTSGIPAGTYSHVRVTMSRIFQITGTVTSGGQACATDGGTDNDNDQMLDAATGTATTTSMYLVDAATYDASDGSTGGDNITISYDTPKYATSIVVSGDLGIMTYKLVKPYTRLLKAPTIKLAFNTKNALGADGNACVMWIEEPFVSITIE